MYPSSYARGWNSWDVGPKRDVVEDVARAVRAKNLTFGIYYSLYEYFHPLYVADAKRKFKTNDFVRVCAKKPDCQMTKLSLNANILFQQVVSPQLRELVSRYKPDIIWSDLINDTASSEYWNATNFLAWLYNESPVRDRVVTNDRWGDGIYCKHGDFYTCGDRFSPGKI